MEENTFFTFIINDEQRTFTILGTLNAEEEVRATNLIAEFIRDGHNLRRAAFNMNLSVVQEIENFLEGHQDYSFVPANEVVPGLQFIDIP